MNSWLPIGLYLGAGVIVFFGLRLAYKRTKIDPNPHYKIWAPWSHSPEIWLLCILLWPVLAIISLLRFAADLLHASGKKEIKQAEALEAQRDKRYDGMDLMEKIDRLKAEVDRTKK